MFKLLKWQTLQNKSKQKNIFPSALHTFPDRYRYFLSACIHRAPSWESLTPTSCLKTPKNINKTNMLHGRRWCHRENRPEGRADLSSHRERQESLTNKNTQNKPNVSVLTFQDAVDCRLQSRVCVGVWGRGELRGVLGLVVRLSSGCER